MSSKSAAFFTRSRKEPSGVCARTGGDRDGFRFFLALEVTLLRRVYRTKVGRSPHRVGSSGVPRDRASSTSAMFCMDVSSRPPLHPSAVAGLLRLTSIPGNAPRGDDRSPSRILSRPM